MYSGTTSFNEEGIFKESAKGLLRVEKNGDDYVLFDEQSEEEERRGELRAVFLNGDLLIDDSLQAIRNKVKKIGEDAK